MGMENFLLSAETKMNTLDLENENKLSPESNPEKVFSMYKPEFDMVLGIPFDLLKEKWVDIQSASIRFFLRYGKRYGFKFSRIST